ncbi:MULTISPECIES: 3-methyl-2-oxobutanoate hydroxymethyltransferase [Thalassospira]|jgi:3-methyl-2-oxobutanoate hydroxymethyltransferase|uniref:3-methyl-2-oxobutanoate hydroxymethyltransferase n=1 Tax=Thalassospira xiamenensis TaxID=220697 RepID=A0A154KY56_9PROT|nr:MULTISPECIES: 3-methyl-2-oxobutanoate hydroxymethyltransferase [Thalassospira]KZB56793.1 3-methyl-2-oxobutanoate hydroxymethyltransferase [Thalassospira xiamenensis]MAZ32576.1 3-methyl-2-oxobutanoate hydroxymethyltransferase [Thalassospira sp.]MCK2167016.1 3-methyl-2-oxobutanoate hydroxymethyltransferase [Thalassospira xiamenensis]RCK51938.1 3-methyl-2-oxobutanoate hydroxymethyltransferase [Thalassospira xiamenensis]WOI12931.1 3-methyl-2-oxobutanoate hydroxymethyltransferase [Thalassospira 
MSATTRKQGRITVPEIRARKGAEPVVCLTAYTTPMAQRLDEHCDLLLVGDSLGMVVYGMESTLAVTVDMMINHGKAVMRGSSNACVIVDLPFGSYQESKEQAFRTASRILAETGCAGVKLEGGAELADTIAFLSQRGIPVMAHIGLMPQQVNTMGGFKSQGRGDDAAAKVLADAKAVAQAGAFSVVVEGTVEAVARRITTEIDIPTIGIGASVACDGQVLVTEDILGMFSDFTPKFVKRYANLGDQISKAVESYATEVRTRQFPTDDHCFGVTKPGKLRAVK